MGGRWRCSGLGGGGGSSTAEFAEGTEGGGGADQRGGAATNGTGPSDESLWHITPPWKAGPHGWSNFSPKAA